MSAGAANEIAVMANAVTQMTQDLRLSTVAAGAVAKKWLREKFGLETRGYMSALGEISIPFVDWKHVRENPFFVPPDEFLRELRDREPRAGA